MYLKANPTKNKSSEEKDELMKQYKSGDDVIPKPRVRVTSSIEDEEEADRRMIEEVREMSLREVGIRGPGSYERGQRRQNASRSPSARDTLRADFGSDHARRLVRDRSIRIWQERNARENSTRSLEHQSSLRSILSNSDDGSNEMKEEILQQIMDEGILDGVNLDELSPAQEDELSEKIADAYRRRHMQSAPAGRSGPQDTRAQSNPPIRQPEQREEQPRARRSRQVTSSSHEPHTSHPPVSRPHLLEAYPVNQGHRRRTSSEHRRNTSPVPHPSTTRASFDVPRQAARSSTDVSAESGTQPRRLEHIRRTTDPSRRQTNEPHTGQTGQSPRASGTTLEARSRNTTSRSPRTSSASVVPQVAPSTTSPRSAQFPAPSQARTSRRPTSENTDSFNASAQSPPRTRIMDRPRGASITTSNDAPYPLASPPEAVTHLRDHSRSTDQPLPLFSEPNFSCRRCSRPAIQYELHHHCPNCPYDICHRCYLIGKGCLHWFGFGKPAFTRWKREGEPGSGPPHVLLSRKYLKPRPDTSLGSPQGKSDHPSQRLRTGFSCASCLEIFDEIFEACGRCNDGEWGFCPSCVDNARCCTHPLYPISYDPLSPSSLPTTNQSTVNSLPHTTVQFPTKSCSLCLDPIVHPPSPTHCDWHCPTCTPSYDLHGDCYEVLWSRGQIPKFPHRSCPKGHTMQSRTLMEDGPAVKYGMTIGQADPNVLFSERKPNAAATTEQSNNATTATLPDREPPSPPSNQQQSQTPEIGRTTGPGVRMTAIWAYYPAKTPSTSTSTNATAAAEANDDELAFPRGAEVWQAQDINGDWAWGWYAGRSGLYPGGYLRRC